MSIGFPCLKPALKVISWGNSQALFSSIGGRGAFRFFLGVDFLVFIDMLLSEGTSL